MQQLTVHVTLLYNARNHRLLALTSLSQNLKLRQRGLRYTTTETHTHRVQPTVAVVMQQEQQSCREQVVQKLLQVTKQAAEPDVGVSACDVCAELVNAARCVYLQASRRRRLRLTLPRL